MNKLQKDNSLKKGKKSCAYTPDPYNKDTAFPQDFGISIRLKNFVDFYIETGQQRDSAIAAGYSKSYANGSAHHLWEKPGVREYYTARMRLIDDVKIAKAKEVMKFLTASLRGEVSEEVIVCEGAGGGVSSAIRKKKQLSARDRLKAAELLAKRYALLTDTFNINPAPVIVDDIDDAMLISAAGGMQGGEDNG